MNATHVRAEAAISTRNGFAVDFADFVIASNPDVQTSNKRSGYIALGSRADTAIRGS
jgi:hypothetical protein